MDYQDFVNRNIAFFQAAGYLKAALDVAKILDNPVFQIKVGKYRDDAEIRMREDLFNLFSAICAQSGAELPPYEKVLYEAWLPKTEDGEKKEAEQVLGLKNEVNRRLKGLSCQDAKLCRSLAEVLSHFPGYDGSYGKQIHPSQLVALINRSLDKIGLEVLRPDYSSSKLSLALGFARPSRPVTIMAVDDRKEDLFKSLKPLFGWPGVTLSFFFCKFREYKECETPAKMIVELSPDIVLMDQGLGNLEGDELVKEIKKLAQGIIFVANTGGSPDKLQNVGALDNFNKGEKLHGVRTAVSMIK
jgi:hypothetical protein